MYNKADANVINQIRDQQMHRHRPVSWDLMIPCYQEDVTQLLVLKIGFHLTESLLCMIRGLEKLVRGVGIHSGEGAENQPVKIKQNYKLRN